MAKWDLIIPIMVAIIALVGTVIPSLINSTYLQNKPQIYTTIEPPQNNVHLIPNSTDVLISNIGSAPATNVSLTLLSSKNITKFIKNYSITDVFFKKDRTQIENQEWNYLNSSVLELYIPKLVQGTGSSIPLTLAHERSYEEKIKVLALYDQGSIGVTKAAIPTMSALFADYWNSYSFYFSILSFIISFLAMGYIFYVVWKQIKSRYIKRLINELLEIRRELLSNSGTRKYLAIKLPKAGLQKIRSVKDYIVVDDLFRNLMERNKNISTENIHKFNQECLDSVNKALNIKWDKYS